MAALWPQSSIAAMLQYDTARCTLFRWLGFRASLTEVESRKECPEAAMRRRGFINVISDAGILASSEELMKKGGLHHGFTSRKLGRR
jgi:hypothetical protein